MNYYKKYIKYKIKYINLKTEYNKQSEQSEQSEKLIQNKQINYETTQNIIPKNQYGGNIKMRIDDNINNKYPILENKEVNMEVNAFGYTHSKIIGGCLF